MKFKYLILILLILILISNTAFATNEDLGSLNNAIIKNRSMADLLGDSSGDVIFGLSRDLFNIARYIVITALLVNLFVLFIDFQMAADAPETKARIKSKALWRSLGLIFCLNFWTLFEFASTIASKLDFS